MMRVLVLAVTVLITMTETRRAAKMSSIWDVILGGDTTDTKDKHEALSTNLVTTKQRQPEEKGLLGISLTSLLSNFSSQLTANKQRTLQSLRDPKPQLLLPRKEREKCWSTWWTSTTVPPQVETCSQHNSQFKYRILGVFPIDGDCERFLMCRSNEKTEKIKGKVYRCPKGDYLAGRRGEDHMLRLQDICSLGSELGVNPRPALLVTAIILSVASWSAVSPTIGQSSSLCHDESQLSLSTILYYSLVWSGSVF